MKRLFTSFSLAFTLMATGAAAEGQASAPELLPLSIFVERLNAEKPDLSEVAYVGIRSGALFYALSEYIDNNARDERDKAIAEKLRTKAVIFTAVGVRIGLRANKRTEESVREQFKMLLKTYMDSIVSYKQANNSIASPLVDNDMNAALSVFSVFESLERESNKKREPAAGPPQGEPDRH